MFETKNFNITGLIEERLGEFRPMETVHEDCKGCKANEVYDFIRETIKRLGADKKVTISYLQKVSSKDGYTDKTVEIDTLRMVDKKLYINNTLIQDGDVRKCDNTISVCRNVLNIQLWMYEGLPVQCLNDKNTTNITGLTEEKLDEVSSVKTVHANLIQINTHKKLLEGLLDPESFQFFKDMGFEGKKKEFIECLLYALDATSFYVDGSDLSQEEYFEVLVGQMNSVVT